MATKPQRDVFSRILRTKRREAGVSQRELARLVDVSPGAVSQWETGETAPRDEATIIKLEEALPVEQNALRGLLGYAPTSGAAEQVVISVADAVEADDRLGARERRLLMALYRELVRNSEGETGS